MAKSSSGLRAPTLGDVIYSGKTFLAAAIALAVGFGAGLENPYWSALTCYVLANPPGAAAVRSKAAFRFAGTIIGGAIVLCLTSLFGDQLNVLGIAYIMVIAAGSYLYHTDRTPMNYLYFAVCVTTAIVGLSNLENPAKTFEIAQARLTEICLGILFMTIVDGVILPEPQTPRFLDDMQAWRNKARDWLTDTVGPDGFQRGDDPARRQALRERLRDLVKGISTIDGSAVQLPFDVGANPPRAYHLDLLRRQVMLIVDDLAALELWLQPLREDGARHPGLSRIADAAAAWVRETPDRPDAPPDAHNARGEALAAEMEAERDRIDAAGDRHAVAARGFLSRLAAAMRDWCDLSTTLRAIADGQRLPPRLEKAARRARPVRSVDYVAAALDLVPMVLAMSFTLAFWYATAWESGPNALLFVFVGTVFLIGLPVKQAAGGLLLGLVIAFCFVFIYNFVILPRATAYETLIIALGCGLIPIGIVMAQNPLGLVTAAMTLSFLGLQNAYSADLAQSLQTLFGSAVGLLIAAIFLSVGRYDQARFTSRRLAAAVRRDVRDVARSSRLPPDGRFISLALYRLSLYFPAAEKLAAGKKLPRLGLLRELSVGKNLLSIRRCEGEASPPVRNVIRAIRDAIGESARNADRDRADPGKLRALVGSSINHPAIVADPARALLRDALMGMDLALTRIPATVHAEGPT